MPRLIAVADARKRDAAIEAVSPRPRTGNRYVAKDVHTELRTERLIKSTDRTSYVALTQRHENGNALAQALIDGDPEIDLEVCGRRLGSASRVYVDQAGQTLYATRTLTVNIAPDGRETGRQDFVDEPATVGESIDPIRWTGKLFAKEELLRKYVFRRKLQLRHVNGLTYDFLFEMARTLHEENKLLHVRPGLAGQQHLIFQSNGTRFNGFLEGRVDGDAYLLVLHLTNLELKRAPEGVDAAEVAT